MDIYINDFDIAYYEFMIEQVQEDQKIQEMLTISKYSNILEGFDDDQIAIYENKVIDTIVEAIKKIIDKVAEFISKAISFLKRDKFVPDQKLIFACEAKIKAMSEEEKDKFIIKEVNSIFDANTIIETLSKDALVAFEMYENITTKFAEFVKGDNVENNQKILDSYNSKIEVYRSNLEKINLDSVRKLDVDFNTIKVLLEDYKKLKDLANTFHRNLAKSEKNIKATQKQIDIIMKFSKEKRDPSHIMNAFRSTYASLSSYALAAKRKHLELFMMNCRTEESILRQFVGYKSDSTTNESAEFFDRLLESMMYEETEEGVVE